MKGSPMKTTNFLHEDGSIKTPYELLAELGIETRPGLTTKEANDILITRLVKRTLVNMAVSMIASIVLNRVIKKYFDK